MEHLRHEGTLHSSSDLLKICVKMGASWSAQVFRQTGVTPSGPGTFRGVMMEISVCFSWAPDNLLLNISFYLTDINDQKISVT